METHAFTQGDEPKTNDTKDLPPNAQAAEPKPPRSGFAAMDRAAVRAIARKGGTVAHQRGTAHRFTSEEARDAGRKGGRAPHRSRGRRARPSSGDANTNNAATPA
jgi:general stress protein YciG